MKATLSTWLGAIFPTVLGCVMTACGPESGPQSGSQTNWLRACQADSECGGLACLCGVCTRNCDAEAPCTDLGGSCLPAADTAAIAACGGQKPASAGLCMLRCQDATCPADQACVAGLCTQLPKPTVHVAVGTSARYQTLAGLGASLPYIEGPVLLHPRKEALFKAIFPDLGLDMLRLRNRYGLADDGDLTTAGEIVRSATANLGHSPVLLITSWSPPPAFKVSGSTNCQGDPETCTMVRSPSGSFDYAAFGAHWRASLDAYAGVGVVPAYIGIQNNPDYVPSADDPGEGCRFLPTEGTATVSVNGADKVVTYPGFAQALSAVVDKLAGIASPPKIMAPEVSGYRSLVEYMAASDPSRVDAIAHHLYGTDPVAIDGTSFDALRKYAASRGKPLFQTEMESDGLGTARLIHYTLAVEGASAYLQNVLVAPSTSAKVHEGPLVSLGSDNFALEDAYHAVRHYALYTDPGWTRVDATSETANLLASAWISPAGDALTLVLINQGTANLDAQIEVGDWAIVESRVLRTVFDGVERSSELGALPAERILRLPPHAMATIALSP